MRKSDVISGYRKLAYLEAVGITPLFSTLSPLTQAPSLRVIFREPKPAVMSGVPLERPSQSDQVAEFEQIKSGLTKSHRREESRSDRAALQGSVHPVSSDIKRPEPEVRIQSQQPAEGITDTSVFPNTLNLGISPLTGSVSATGYTEDPERSSTRDLSDANLPSKFSVLCSGSARLAAISLELEPGPQHWSLLRNICVACDPPSLNENCSEIKIVEFHWPMPGLDKVSDPSEAAQHALTGFLSKHCQPQCERILVFGEVTQRAGSLFLSGWDTSKILVAPSVADLLSFPNLKKTLWEEMKRKGFA